MDPLPFVCSWPFPSHSVFSMRFSRCQMFEQVGTEQRAPPFCWGTVPQSPVTFLLPAVLPGCHGAQEHRQGSITPPAVFFCREFITTKKDFINLCVFIVFLFPQHVNTMREGALLMSPFSAQKIIPGAQEGLS